MKNDLSPSVLEERTDPIVLEEKINPAVRSAFMGNFRSALEAVSELIDNCLAKNKKKIKFQVKN